VKAVEAVVGGGFGAADAVGEDDDTNAPGPVVVTSDGDVLGAGDGETTSTDNPESDADGRP